jgi:AcrR family transcriptional regulator
MTVPAPPRPARSGLDRPLGAGAPRPLLSRSAEARLGARHREVLDELEHLFLTHGFVGWTIGGLAARVGCSRRTLYELAPSKDELVLVVLDRLLHARGRSSLDAIDPTDGYAVQLRSYLTGGVTFELRPTLVRHLADDAPARRLVDRHYRFAMSVIERLVELGVRSGEFRPVDPALVAAMIAGTGLYLGHPEVAEHVSLPDDQVGDALLDLLMPALTGR